MVQWRRMLLDVWDTHVNTCEHDIRDVNEHRDHWKKRKSLLVGFSYSYDMEKA